MRELEFLFSKFIFEEGPGTAPDPLSVGSVPALLCILRVIVYIPFMRFGLL